MQQRTYAHMGITCTVRHTTDRIGQEGLRREYGPRYCAEHEGLIALDGCATRCPDYRRVSSTPQLTVRPLAIAAGYRWKIPDDSRLGTHRPSVPLTAPGTGWRTGIRQYGNAPRRPLFLSEEPSRLLPSPSQHRGLVNGSRDGSLRGALHVAVLPYSLPHCRLPDRSGEILSSCLAVESPS